VIGLFETPVEAARARDAEIVRLGLAAIARMNEGLDAATALDEAPVAHDVGGDRSGREPR
jgi:hypothetical protein